MINLIKHQMRLRKISAFKFGLAAAVINAIAIAIIFYYNINLSELLRLYMVGNKAAAETLLGSYKTILAIVLPITFTINGILFIIPIINIIFTFEKDMWKHRYILFSLPVKSSELIGSRLIVACIDFAVAVAFVVLFTLCLMYALARESILFMVFGFVMANPIVLILHFITSILEFALFILILYFFIMAIRMSKIMPSRFKKGFGIALGIITFNILLSVWESFANWVAQHTSAFNLNIDMSSIKTTIPMIDSSMHFNDLNVNFAVTLVELALFVVLFICVAYTMDKKYEV